MNRWNRFQLVRTTAPPRSGGSEGRERPEPVPGTVQAADGAPTVIFIAGSGRSGSTLLERALGEIPGFVNVGELIDVFRRDVSSERCGCGEPFVSCPFWSRVGKRVFDDWEPGELAAVRRLERRIARQRYMPRLLALPLAPGSFGRDVARLGDSYKALYEAIAMEAEAACVVDASKWPVQALALHRGGIDVRVIHLIRDVRGVAHSLSKHDVARPHGLKGTEVMWSKRPAAAAVRWLTYHSQVELLPRCGVPVTRVRYEDFVCDPRRTVKAALAALKLPYQPTALEHLGEGSASLGPSHGVSGNPSRFRYGEITLHPDETWRTEMSRRNRVLVTAIGLPFLMRYGRKTGGSGAASTGVPSRLRPVAADSGVPGRPGRVAGRSEWPRVSVILPTRGRPQLVRESIAGVVGQSYPGEIDCIVVHDQEAADETLASLGTALHRVRVAANRHAPGLAGARNTGLDVADGEFIATCDDDDVWHPAKLKCQITRMLEEDDLLVTGSGMRLLLPNNKVLSRAGRAERISYELLLRNRVKELHSSTLVMRREAFAKAGRYDEDLPHGYAEDYDWILRAARVGQIGIVTQPLADIRKNAQSWYAGKARNTASALEYMLAKHPDIAASPRGHARMLGQIAFARSCMGDRGVALSYAMKALAKWPASPYPYMALAQITTRVHPQHVQRAARLLRRDIA
jgi:Glycosyl transferase family 2/Sulfotransferase family